MKTLVLFGAGKSATCLIDHLLKGCNKNEWQLNIIDSDLNLVNSKIGNTKNAFGYAIDVTNGSDRVKMISKADLVISLLPPHLHLIVAEECLNQGRNLINASYVDDTLRSLDKQVKRKGLLFLCEMGLDPGIDHMSAMKLFSKIRQSGGTITSFKSHCGGLVAPESDNNPWHYKITWNPRNIILAGKDGAVYKKNNVIVNVDYRNVFAHGENITIPGLAPMTWYPNRDSKKYIDLYELHSIQTFLRTTLRYPSFCKGWNYFVNLGLTDVDDQDIIRQSQNYKDWFAAKKAFSNVPAVLNIKREDEAILNELENYLDINRSSPLPGNATCSADIVQYLFEEKLNMNTGDKDMIVMLHEIEFEKENKKYKTTSSLIVKGSGDSRTAMAKTVGLPLGIAAELLLNKQISLTGVHIPVHAEIYIPTLNQLEKEGIVFEEHTVEIIRN
jgi:saccharopine dehydrogenase (NADP+, L-glutamate forming)